MEVVGGQEISLSLFKPALFGKTLGIAPDHVAKELLDRSYPKAQAVVEDLIADYELDRELLTLSGGGGGAIALVPYTAKQMGLPFEIAPNAPNLHPSQQKST